jgi:hypothetical protein
VSPRESIRDELPISESSEQLKNYCCEGARGRPSGLPGRPWLASGRRPGMIIVPLEAGPARAATRSPQPPPVIAAMQDVTGSAAPRSVPTPGLY